MVHALTAAVELGATVLSVDGVGAFDTVSRKAMLVRQFYASPSEFVWHDAAGQPHTVTQAEGGEQGDPLMPALFSLGQRAALADWLFSMMCT